MSDQEILTKAIQKAIDSGWTGSSYMPLGGDWLGDPPKWEIKQPFKDAMIIYTTGGVNCIDVHINTEHIIFNHDFAKALWGDRYDNFIYFNTLNDKSGTPTLSTYAWQYHLQQMVIADDPIKYLGDNI